MSAPAGASSGAIALAPVVPSWRVLSWQGATPGWVRPRRGTSPKSKPAGGDPWKTNAIVREAASPRVARLSPRRSDAKGVARARPGRIRARLRLGARDGRRRPSAGGGAIPERLHNESEERLYRGRELGGKIAQHSPSRRSSLADRPDGYGTTAQLHVGAPPRCSPQLIRGPVDGNFPPSASRRFSRRKRGASSHERETSASIASQLKRIAVDLARHCLGEAPTRQESAVTRVVANGVARRSPADPLDREH